MTAQADKQPLNPLRTDDARASALSAFACWEASPAADGAVVFLKMVKGLPESGPVRSVRWRSALSQPRATGYTTPGLTVRDTKDS